MVKQERLDKLLTKLGFTSDGNDFYYDFGNCNLKVIKGFNTDLNYGFHFMGTYSTHRTSGIINFYLPLEVESFEQGLALLVYNLRNAALAIKPDWLNEGLNFQDHLPWVQRLKKFDAIPKAHCEHEWFRPLLTKLKLLSKESNDNDLTTFSFENNILSITCNNQNFVITGNGTNWHQVATVKTQSLNFLPDKISKQGVILYILDNNLHIDSRRFELINS